MDNYDKQIPSWLLQPRSPAAPILRTKLCRFSSFDLLELFWLPMLLSTECRVASSILQSLPSAHLTAYLNTVPTIRIASSFAVSDVMQSSSTSSYDSCAATYRSPTLVLSRYVKTLTVARASSTCCSRSLTTGAAPTLRVAWSASKTPSSSE